VLQRISSLVQLDVSCALNAARDAATVRPTLFAARVKCAAETIHDFTPFGVITFILYLAMF